MKEFLKRKNIIISAKRYGVDALGAMAQGLFCSLLIGTIIDTVGTQFNIDFLTRTVATLGTGDHALSYTVGGLASAMSGPAMAIAIGYALQAPPLVLFSLATVGFAANTLGGAGGPLAVLFVAILAAELGKLVSKETKVDILVTPLVTIAIGVGLSAWWAPAIGTAASSVGQLIMWATELQPLLMGILVSVIVGIALTLPISSAAICAALSLTGLAGGAAVADHGGRQWTFPAAEPGFCLPGELAAGAAFRRSSLAVRGAGGWGLHHLVLGGGGDAASHGHLLSSVYAAGGPGLSAPGGV